MSLDRPLTADVKTEDSINNNPFQVEPFKSFYDAIHTPLLTRIYAYLRADESSADETFRSLHVHLAQREELQYTIKRNPKDEKRLQDFILTLDKSVEKLLPEENKASLSSLVLPTLKSIFSTNSQKLTEKTMEWITQVAHNKQLDRKLVILALAYDYGLYKETNRTSAIEFYKKAQNRGNTQAKAMLKCVSRYRYSSDDEAIMSGNTHFIKNEIKAYLWEHFDSTCDNYSNDLYPKTLTSKHHYSIRDLAKAAELIGYPSAYRALFYLGRSTYPVKENIAQYYRYHKVCHPEQQEDDTFIPRLCQDYYGFRLMQLSSSRSHWDNPETIYHFALTPNTNENRVYLDTAAYSPFSVTLLQWQLHGLFKKLLEENRTASLLDYIIPNKPDSFYQNLTRIACIDSLEGLLGACHDPYHHQLDFELHQNNIVKVLELTIKCYEDVLAYDPKVKSSRIPQELEEVSGPLKIFKHGGRLSSGFYQSGPIQFFPHGDLHRLAGRLISRLKELAENHPAIFDQYISDAALNNDTVNIQKAKYHAETFKTTLWKQIRYSDITLEDLFAFTKTMFDTDKIKRACAENPQLDFIKEFVPIIDRMEFKDAKYCDLGILLIRKMQTDPKKILACFLYDIENTPLAIREQTFAYFKHFFNYIIENNIMASLDSEDIRQIFSHVTEYFTKKGEDCSTFRRVLDAKKRPAEQPSYVTTAVLPVPTAPTECTVATKGIFAPKPDERYTPAAATTAVTATMPIAATTAIAASPQFTPPPGGPGW